MGLVLRGFSYFPLFEERRLLVRAAEYILVDLTNKSYGLSLGRYARRRDPIGIHEVHLAIVMQFGVDMSDRTCSTWNNCPPVDPQPRYPVRLDLFHVEQLSLR